MQVSGKYDSPTAVIVGQYPVSVEQEAGWAPQTVWIVWRRDNLCLCLVSNPGSSILSPSHYSDRAILSDVKNQRFLYIYFFVDFSFLHKTNSHNAVVYRSCWIYVYPHCVGTIQSPRSALSEDDMTSKKWPLSNTVNDLASFGIQTVPQSSSVPETATLPNTRVRSTSYLYLFVDHADPQSRKKG